MKNKIFILIILIALFASTVSFAGGKTETAEKGEKGKRTEQSNENNAARVNGNPITKEEWESEIAIVEEQMAVSGNPIPEDQMGEFRLQVLEGMINRRLLLGRAEELGIEFTQEEINERYEQITSQFESEEELENALAAQALTEKRLKRNISDSLIIQELVTEEVESKITITDQDVQDFYDNNPDQFSQPEQIQASHIITTFDANGDDSQRTAALGRIEEIQKRVEAGEDFGELAMELSEGPSAPQRGDLGYFGRGQMVPPFEEAAFDLDIGEVSDIVETQFGFHIIKLTDKKEAQTIPLDQIKPQVKEYLFQEKASTQFDVYLEDIREEGNVEIYVDQEDS